MEASALLRRLAAMGMSALLAAVLAFVVASPTRIRSRRRLPRPRSLGTVLDGTSSNAAIEPSAATAP